MAIDHGQWHPPKYAEEIQFSINLTGSDILVPIVSWFLAKKEDRDATARDSYQLIY